MKSSSSLPANFAALHDWALALAAVILPLGVFLVVALGLALVLPARRLPSLTEVEKVWADWFRTGAAVMLVCAAAWPLAMVTQMVTQIVFLVPTRVGTRFAPALADEAWRSYFRVALLAPLAGLLWRQAAPLAWLVCRRIAPGASTRCKVAAVVLLLLAGYGGLQWAYMRAGSAIVPDTRVTRMERYLSEVRPNSRDYHDVPICLVLALGLWLTADFLARRRTR